MIIDGKKLALEKEKQLKHKLQKLIKSRKRKPLLISLVAKEDQEGLLYTKLKEKKALKIGIDFKKFIFSLKKRKEIHNLLKKVCQTKNLDGLMIQKPGQALANKYFKNKNEFSYWWSKAVLKIPLKIDVDCLNPNSLGLLFSNLNCYYPATVKAVLEILYLIFKKDKLEGKKAVILGSSEILGKPLALVLRNKGMTVFWAGSSCKDLKSLLKNGEIIVSCTGKPNLITADMIKKGAVVIDVGICKVGSKIFGDVNFEKTAKKAKYITPVPGGVGPLTVISLMENVVKTYAKKNRGFDF